MIKISRLSEHKIPENLPGSNIIKSMSETLVKLSKKRDDLNQINEDGTPFFKQVLQESEMINGSVTDNLQTAELCYKRLEEHFAKTQDTIGQELILDMLIHISNAVSKIDSVTEEVSDSELARRKELYKKWQSLINMSVESLENFKEKQTAAGKKDPKKYPGLRPSQAKEIGISSGVQSANWIIKMKRAPVKDWTPEMWKWAGKQVSFVSRMLGNQGPLRNPDGTPTRKMLSLMIWGHRPK
jgi:hypothetical protein